MTRDTFAAKGEPLANDGPIQPDPFGDGADSGDYAMDLDATAWLRVGEHVVLHISTHRGRLAVEALPARDVEARPLSLFTIPLED